MTAFIFPDHYFFSEFDRYGVLDTRHLMSKLSKFNI